MAFCMIFVLGGSSATFTPHAQKPFKLNVIFKTYPYQLNNLVNKPRTKIYKPASKPSFPKG